MNIIAELRPGEGYMKFKSLYALHQDESDLLCWFDEEWQKLDRINDLAKAVFDGDGAALAKADSPDLAIARAENQ